MYKVYIKSLLTNKYLNPIYSQNRWVEKKDATYFKVNNLEGLKAIDLIDLSLIEDDIVELYYIENGKEILVSSSNKYNVNYSQIKCDFIDFKNKKIEHYIIYNFILEKDIYYGINIGKKHKFNIFLSKINHLVKMIENYDVSYKYLKYPFPSIKKSEFEKIVKDLSRYCL